MNLDIDKLKIKNTTGSSGYSSTLTVIIPKELSFTRCIIQERCLRSSSRNVFVTANSTLDLLALANSPSKIVSIRISNSLIVNHLQLLRQCTHKEKQITVQCNTAQILKLLTDS